VFISMRSSAHTNVESHDEIFSREKPVKKKKPQEAENWKIINLSVENEEIGRV